jgi:hypothetical protein
MAFTPKAAKARFPELKNVENASHKCCALSHGLGRTEPKWSRIATNRNLLAVMRHSVESTIKTESRPISRHAASPNVFRFLKYSTSPLKSVRCETGEPLADILLTFEDESLAFVEVKRSLEFGAARMKPLVSHLIEQYLASLQGTSGGKFPWRRRLDGGRDRLLLVTSSDAPVRLTHHLSACLSRIHPEARPENLAAIPQNEAEKEAFESFLAVLNDAWKALLGEQLQDGQVVELLSLFRIAVLDVNARELCSDVHGHGIPTASKSRIAC